MSPIQFIISFVIAERPTHRHQFYCPTHGYWSYSDSDYSDYEDDDDDECYSDNDECLEEEEEDLVRTKF